MPVSYSMHAVIYTIYKIALYSKNTMDHLLLA